MMFLLVLIFVPFVTSSCPLIYADRIKAYDEKKISKTPLWTLNNLRKSECIHRCYNETSCFSVHFNTPGSTCTAFREKFNDVTVASSPQSGHRLYQMRKIAAVPGSPCEEVDCDSLPNSLCIEGSCTCDQGYDADGDTCRILTAPVVPGSPCEEEVDCDSLPNSQCIMGSCTCDQGYDADGDTCRILTDCTSFSTSFTRYRECMLSVDFIPNDSDLGLASCQEACLGEPACTSLNRNVIFSYCFLISPLWTEVSPSNRRNSSSYDFYQRRCNW